METKTCKIAKFNAPTGNYRQIVFDYMYSMSQIKWTPKKTMKVGWKNAGDFGVDLVYEEGETYYGIPYAGTKSTLDLFEQYVDNGVFDFHSSYFEEVIGNHCSSSMGLAFQQLVDMPYYGGIKPCHFRGTNFAFPKGIAVPEYEDSDLYDSKDFFNVNGKNSCMEAYASLDTADILYFSIRKKSGHTRMVSKKGEVVRNEYGFIDPEQSYLYVLEQTNAWDKTRTDGVKTTWFVNRKYTFEELHKKMFMPITLTIYTSGDKAKDAYIMFDGNNTPDSIKNGLSGKVETTFPMSYVRITIKDEKGSTVKSVLKYNYEKMYCIDLSDCNEELGIASLPEGKYTYTLRAAIARGGWDIESFDFTV